MKVAGFLVLKKMNSKKNRPNLVLGGAQFGMDYGATNLTGKLLSNDIEKIISEYIDSGFRYIDTSSEYGDSQYLIGKNKHKLIVNTKLKYIDLKREYKKEEVFLFLEKSFEKSLMELNGKEIDVLFIHQMDIIGSEYCDYYFDFLKSIKFKGLIKRIGVSIYSEDDFKRCYNYYDVLDVVQAPINIFNRSIYDEFKDVCEINDISIQARSIFLQGVLLDSTKCKVKIPKYIISRIDNFTKYIVNNKKEKYKFLVDSVCDLDLESVVVGVSGYEDWVALRDQWKTPIERGDYELFKFKDDWLNPSNWETK